MYRLRDLKNGKYQIHVKNGEAFEGTTAAILEKCVMDLGFDVNEVEDAMIDLHVGNFDYAEFGVFKRYMYCLNDEKRAA